MMVQEPQAAICGWLFRHRLIEQDGALPQAFLFLLCAPGSHPCTAPALAFHGRQVVMSPIWTWKLKPSLCLKHKLIVINKSCIWEKMSRRNAMANNILKISGVVMSTVYETLTLACSGLFRKGKALCQWFPDIQTNVTSSEKHILLHNGMGQVNALIGHWNGFAATVSSLEGKSSKCN